MAYFRSQSHIVFSNAGVKKALRCTMALKGRKPEPRGCANRSAYTTGSIISRSRFIAFTEQSFILTIGHSFVWLILQVPNS